MRRQWILIGQSIRKTIRTIGDKKFPSRGGRNRTRTWAKSRPVTAGTVINGLHSEGPRSFTQLAQELRVSVLKSVTDTAKKCKH